MSTEYHTTPEPTGGPTYTDPADRWDGAPVTIEWAGRPVEGVVSDVTVEHTNHRFEPLLKVDAGSATFTVTPDDITHCSPSADVRR